MSRFSGFFGYVFPLIICNSENLPHLDFRQNLQHLHLRPYNHRRLSPCNLHTICKWTITCVFLNMVVLVISNSSALDNILLIPFTELLFHYLSETYWLRDILVAYISTVGLVRDGFMHSSEFWYFAKWTFKCFSFILD